MNTNLPNLRFFDRDEFLTPFDRIFDEIFARNHPNFHEEFGINFWEKGAYPKVDVYDHNDKLALILEIPGLTRNQISVEIEKGILTISGEKHSHPLGLETEWKCIKKELKYSSFKRSFELGNKLKHDSIKAKFSKGILEIQFDKLVPEKPVIKTVEIE